MKKVLLTVLVGALAGLTIMPARAEDDSEKKFEFNGEVRARYEYLNNYLDLRDSQDSTEGVLYNDQMSIAPYRVDIGMTGHFSKNVSAHVDLQYTGAMGDRWSPSMDNPWDMPFAGTPMGQGDTAYQYSTQGIQLYQGYVDVAKIGGSDFGLRFGRAEHTYGTELFMGNNYYYSGQSFDGLRGMWKHGSNDLNVFYYKIAAENCFGPCFGIGTSSDSNFWGATYDWTFDTMGALGGYVMVAQDLGGDGPVFFPDSQVTTYGVRWNRGMMNGDKLNMLDWNIEVAAQSGDAGEPYGGPKTTLGGSILEGWFAYNFNAGSTHGRVHIGALMTSGDKSDTTDKYEGFINLYGDFHKNNRLGDLDWIDQFGPSDITDYNIGYEHWFGTSHSVMIAYHMFNATESYTGYDGNKHSGLGSEIDLKYGYQYSKNLALEAMIGQASGDKYAFGFVPPDSPDNVQRIAVQAKLNW